MKGKGMENTAQSFEQYRQEVAAAAAEHQLAVRDFLQADTPDRQNALLDQLKMLGADERQAAKKAFNLYADSKTGVNLRLKALKKTYNYIHGQVPAVKKVIRVMLNKREYPAIRQASLDALLAISFSSTALLSVLGEFKDALRKLVGDKEIYLSTRAIEALSGYRDEFVQDILAKGLRDHAQALVTDAKAIQLLSTQRTSGYNDLIREKLQSSKDPQVITEAVHALSSDPASLPAIQQVLNDKSTLKNARLASLAAVNSLNPDGFVDQAKSILIDTADFPDVKIASMSAISLQPKYHAVFGDEQLTEQVKTLTSHENAALSQESNRYLANAADYLNALK
jgi:hypothetical protein